jgi:hypothetical protein
VLWKKKKDHFSGIWKKALFADFPQVQRDAHLMQRSRLVDAFF